MMKSFALIFSLAIVFSCNSCKDKGFNIFSIEDDKQLGLQLQQEIAANPGDYPVLNEAQYSAAYAHIYRMRDSILNSGNVQHKDDFEWDVKIIRDDSTLNAFCAPGGYIYVYTGLIKFLDSEDQLAGVLAHEIAHADKRHSTQQLTKSYSISLLLQVVLGENAQLLSEIAQGLVALKFSRADESEADEFSVKYLCPTGYNAAGAAGFFDKLIQMEQAGGTPQFLSTHPNPDNRVADINAHRTAFNCNGTGTFDARYQQLINSLP